MRSAPNIQSQISDRGEITGHFDEQAVDRYVQVLNAGTLPVLLRKVEAGEEKQAKTSGWCDIGALTQGWVA